MIARSDETWPVWAGAHSEEAILRPGLRPAVGVSDADRMRLAQAGGNTLLSVRGGSRPGGSPRPPGAGGGGRGWPALPGRPPGAVLGGRHAHGTRRGVPGPKWA